MNRLYSLQDITSFCLSKPDAKLIVDTNIFLLLFIGIYDPEYLKRCPLMTGNGKNYEKKHFDLMLEILGRFRNNIVITPHILSEINMLSRRDIKTPHFDAYFTKMVKKLENCKEHLVELGALLKSGGIREFGFADISLVEAAREKKWAILTDEFDLYRTFNEHVPIIYFSAVVAQEIQKVYSKFL